jgi:molybdopterin-biosynthesis enzyme MoeA-like protein
MRYIKKAYKILEAYYKPGEFNEGRQKMVWMPENANLILNPYKWCTRF